MTLPHRVTARRCTSGRNIQRGCSRWSRRLQSRSLWTWPCSAARWSVWSRKATPWGTRIDGLWIMGVSSQINFWAIWNTVYVIKLFREKACLVGPKQLSIVAVQMSGNYICTVVALWKNTFAKGHLSKDIIIWQQVLCMPLLLLSRKDTSLMRTELFGRRGVPTIGGLLYWHLELQ